MTATTLQAMTARGMANIYQSISRHTHRKIKIVKIKIHALFDISGMRENLVFGLCGPVDSTWPHGPVACRPGVKSEGGGPVDGQ